MNSKLGFLSPSAARSLRPPPPPYKITLASSTRQSPPRARSSSSPTATTTPLPHATADVFNAACDRLGRPSMGCAFSSSSGGGGLRPFAGVRVIHTNGYVQYFDDDGDGPVTVARATAATSASSSRYVLCSSAHLLQPGRAPYRPDDALEPGTVYFLLPHSVFQSESSAVDLACLMNRLTALARKSGGSGSGTPGPSPVEALFAGDHPDRKPPPVGRPRSDKCCTAAAPAPWKPRLDRIDESIGRASMRSASSCSDLSQD